MEREKDSDVSPVNKKKNYVKEVVGWRACVCL